MAVIRFLFAFTWENRTKLLWLLPVITVSLAAWRFGVTVSIETAKCAPLEARLREVQRQYAADPGHHGEELLDAWQAYSAQADASQLAILHSGVEFAAKVQAEQFKLGVKLAR